MNKWEVIKGELACQEVFIVIKKEATGKIKRSGVFEDEEQAQKHADKMNRATEKINLLKESFKDEV